MTQHVETMGQPQENMNKLGNKEDNTMKVNNSFRIALAALFALILGGCQEVVPIEENMDSTKEYSLVVNAEKSVDETKALALAGKTLTATWAIGETVTVYNVTRSTELTGTLAAQSSGSSTKLTGNIEGTIAVGDELELRFCSPDYSNQEGTIEYIAANCDYATARINVSEINGTRITASDASFENKQAIVKFSLQDKSGNSLVSNRLTISDGSNTFTVAPTSATNVVYVALPDITSKNLTIEAYEGTDAYKYEKSGVSLLNGKYYEITVKMSFDALATPLTIVASADDASVFYDRDKTIEYTVDNGATWISTSGFTSIVLSNAGDKVSFRGENDSYYKYNGGSVIRCSETPPCTVYGNIMSMVSSDSFPTETTITGTYAFHSFFIAQHGIDIDPQKALVLPATTLASQCYYQMFQYCTSLTKAPELPATTLAYGCYYGMFALCSSLVNAPNLPATTLAQSCYGRMFESCTSLTTAPELPATSLADGCYMFMFRYCSSLETAPELPATTIARDCYSEMFNGCTSLTTGPSELPATVIAVQCYSLMFKDCSNLVTAPDLPATTLTEGCYRRMFEGCSNLTSIRCLATTLESGGVYESSEDRDNETYCWLSGVSATGTFVKDASATFWKTGVNGIPSTWTVINE